jgi:tetratricopeptide (TPR) repeat protein
VTKYLLSQKALQTAQALHNVRLNQSPQSQSQVNDQLTYIQDFQKQGSSPQEIDQDNFIFLELYAKKQQWESVIKLCNQIFDDSKFQQLSYPKQAEIYKYLGVAYQELRCHDPAKRAYRQALSICPDFAEVYANLGTLQTLSGDFKAAIACYQKALTLNPQFAGAYRNLGRLWERVGDETRALVCWSRSLALEPLGISLAQQVKLGQRWAQLGNFLEAEQCYRRVINFDVRAGAVWEALGTALAHQKRWNEAILAYERAIALGTQSAQGYGGLARSFAALQNWSQATLAYHQAALLDPQSDEVWHQWGDTLAKLQRWGDATVAYQRAIALNGDHPWSHNNLGDALIQQSRWVEAAAAYRVATQRQPNFVWAFYHLGDALTHLKQWDEAVMAYRAAMELKEDLPEIELKLARAYRARIEFDREAAASWYAKAIAKTPGSVLPEELPFELSSGVQGAVGTVDDAMPSSLKDRCGSESPILPQSSAQSVAKETAEAEFNRGKGYLEAGQVDPAKAAFRKAIALDPQCVWAHHYLGDLLRKEGDREAALAAYDRAIGCSNSPPFWSYYNRAQLQAEQGDREAAIASYQVAASIDPDYSWTHKHLGDLLASQGDLDAASRAYRQAVAGSPKIS